MGPFDKRIANVEEWIGAIVDVIGVEMIVERLKLRAEERAKVAAAQAAEGVTDGQPAAEVPTPTD